MSTHLPWLCTQRSIPWLKFMSRYYVFITDRDLHKQCIPFSGHYDLLKLGRHHCLLQWTAVPFTHILISFESNKFAQITAWPVCSTSLWIRMDIGGLKVRQRVAETSHWFWTQHPLSKINSKVTPGRPTLLNSPIDRTHNWWTAVPSTCQNAWVSSGLFPSITVNVYHAFFPIPSLASHDKACSGPLKRSEETSEHVYINLIVLVLRRPWPSWGSFRQFSRIYFGMLDQRSSPPHHEPVTAIRDLDMTCLSCPPTHHVCVPKGAYSDSNSWVDTMYSSLTGTLHCLCTDSASPFSEGHDLLKLGCHHHPLQWVAVPFTDIFISFGSNKFA